MLWFGSGTPHPKVCSGSGSEGWDCDTRLGFGSGCFSDSLVSSNSSLQHWFGVHHISAFPWEPGGDSAEQLEVPKPCGTFMNIFAIKVRKFPHLLSL